MAVILTKRRNADDVFLIGEETLPGQEPDDDLDATESIAPAVGESLASPPPARSTIRSPGSLHGARGIALLGLGAAAAATLGVLELGGGGNPASVHRQTPTRSPLITRSAALAPAGPRLPRPSVVHHDKPPRRRRPRHRRPTVVHTSETEREPTQSVAPVSSPVQPTTALPAPAPPVAASPSAPTPTPSPPPPSSGGGSGGVERFGFQG